MRKITVYISDASLEKLVHDELTERLEILENDKPSHPEDIAYRKRMMPAYRIVIDG